MLASGKSLQPFRTVKDHDAFLARLAQVPPIFDQAIADMREGVRAGVVQPRPVMEKVVPQLDALAADTPEASAFWGAVAAMPEGFPPAERERLTAAYRLPRCRDTAGYAALPEALLAGYRDLRARVNALLPRLRPGVFYVNTHDLRGQPKFGMETLSLHEASPGHQFQISIAQEVTGLPRFRRFGGYVAYAEGWALYAESIGKELGLFTDPLQWYGRLSDELQIREWIAAERARASRPPGPAVSSGARAVP